MLTKVNNKEYVIPKLNDFNTFRLAYMNDNECGNTSAKAPHFE